MYAKSILTHTFICTSFPKYVSYQTHCYANFLLLFSVETVLAFSDYSYYASVQLYSPLTRHNGVGRVYVLLIFPDVVYCLYVPETRHYEVYRLYIPVIGYISTNMIYTEALRCLYIPQGPVSLRLMTSQFKDRNSHAKIHDSKMHILRCMGSKYCVKFQRCPLKFHTKFWTHTPQNMHFMRW